MLLLSRVYEIPGARILDRLIDRVHAIEGEGEGEIPPPPWKPIETAEKGLSIRLYLSNHASSSSSLKILPYFSQTTSSEPLSTPAFDDNG